VYWQLTTDITLLQCPGNWRHTVTVYCHSLTNVELVLFIKSQFATKAQKYPPLEWSMDTWIPPTMDCHTL